MMHSLEKASADFVEHPSPQGARLMLQAAARAQGRILTCQLLLSTILPLVKDQMARRVIERVADILGEVE